MTSSLSTKSEEEGFPFGLDYTRCYCEENVFKLCERKGGRGFALFISQVSRKCPIACQRSGNPEHQGMVVWDYHVVYVSEDKRFIFDLDSTLPFPCPTRRYLITALWKYDTSCLAPRFFRLVHASSFLTDFCSDRSHMMSSERPSWPCIRPDGVHFFTMYLDAAHKDALSRNQLCEALGQKPHDTLIIL